MHFTIAGEHLPMVTIAGDTWHEQELAALVSAARTLVRGIRLERVTGVEIAVPTRPHLWALLEALDAPSLRREGLDPALHGDEAAA